MKVFLVEDSPLVCERLVEMIEADGLSSVVGQASTYDDALTGIAATAPDVGILDIQLARGSGIAALIEAKRRQPGLVGIVMSNSATPQYKKASADAGAAFFLDKSADFERIVETLASISESNQKGES